MASPQSSQAAQPNPAFNSYYIPTDKKEIKNWCRLQLQRISNYALSPSLIQRRIDYAKWFALADGKFDPYQFSYIWGINGIPKPMNYTTYPLLSVLVDATVGDWLDSNLVFSVLKVNPEASSEKMDLEGHLTFLQLIKPYLAQIEQLAGSKLPMDDRMDSLPDNVKRFMTYDYRDMEEDTVYNLINYIIEAHDEKSEFATVLKDICICNDGYGKIVYENGDPMVRRIHPMFALVDIGVDDYPSDKIIDKQLDAFGEELYLTHSEILYNYGYWMSDEDKEKLKSQFAGFIAGTATTTTFNGILYFINTAGTLRMRCVEGQWKARNDREFPTSWDETTNKPINEMMDIFDTYEGVMIGRNIYCKLQRKKNILRNGDNYRNCQLDYFGILTKFGIYPKAAPLQMLYNTVMAHIEFAIAQAGGKAFVIYVDELPTDNNGKVKEVDDAVYDAKVKGIILKKRTEGVPLGGYPDNYQQVDFGISSTINNLYLFKGMIEQTASRMTGISPERFGFAKQDSAVHNTQSNIQYSAVATQPLFYAHARFVNTGLQKISDLGKVVWAKNDTRAYVMGDMGMKIIQMNDKLCNSDYGIFVRNSMKDATQKKTLADAALAGMATDPTLILEYIQITNAGSLVSAEKVVKASVDAMRVQQQQMATLKQQELAQNAQSIQQNAQILLKTGQDKNETEKYKADTAANAVITSAQIRATGGENVKTIENKGKLDHQILKDSGEEIRQKNDLENQNESPPE